MRLELLSGSRYSSVREDVGSIFDEVGIRDPFGYQGLGPRVGHVPLHAPC